MPPHVWWKPYGIADASATPHVKGCYTNSVPTPTEVADIIDWFVADRFAMQRGSRSFFLYPGLAQTFVRVANFPVGGMFAVIAFCHNFLWLGSC
jgi:hypothetical protein